MKSNAFTLIELMIVVAIIVFLSVLAVPHLFQYKARAYQAEVAMNLASLHTAQQAYFAQHGHYSNVLYGENGLGWRPAGYQGNGKEENFYYTYGFNFSGAQEGVNFFTGKLKTSKDSLGDANVTNDTFVAAAAGTIKENSKADIWRINENRSMEHVQNGID